MFKENKTAVIRTICPEPNDTGTPKCSGPAHRADHLPDRALQTHTIRDHTQRQGLLYMVNKRRTLLEYLRKNSLEPYKGHRRLSLRK